MVASVDTCLELKALGFKKPSRYAHYFNAGKSSGAVVLSGVYDDASEDFKDGKILPAYTLSELCEFLRKPIRRQEGQFNEIYDFTIQAFGENWVVFYQTIHGFRALDDNSGIMQSSNPATACASMLVYLIRNNFFTV